MRRKDNRSRFRLWRVLIALSVCYFIYAGIVSIIQTHLIFPTRTLGPAVAPWRATFGEHMRLGPHDVDALYYPASGLLAPAVIVAHGNGERIEHWDREARMLRDSFGVHVLVIEFPGYQDDSGKPSQETIAKGFVAGFDWLQPNPGVTEIHGLGRSIGTGVVCDLATRRDLASLALLTPFESLRGMARRRLIPDFLVQSPFDNRKVLADFRGEVVLVVAEDDEIFSGRHTESLSDAAPSSTVIQVPGGHNSVLSHGDLFFPQLASLWHTSASDFSDH